jgi:signal peptidase I
VRSGLIAAAVAISAIALAGCGGGGGSSQGSANGSPPVETIARPSITTTYDVPSSSMEPTLHCARPGSGCEASIADQVRVEGPVQDPQRGDILVFKTPPAAVGRCGAGGTFIKRLIALPGETWEERNGYIFINGKKLDEPYVKPERRDTATSYPPRKIPQGMYFLIGDYRTQSCDSREFGPVPSENIVGKVVRILRTQ